MRDDLAAALRSLRCSRGVTLVAIAVLTLGIGATTAIFTVVDAVVLRGLPFDEHDRLVAVGEIARTPAGAADSTDLRRVAPQNYLDWIEGQRVFEAMAAIGSGQMSLRLPGAPPEPLKPRRVTAGFFDVLRVRPARGRAFTAGDEVAGRDRVAILADGLWRRRFGGDPSIIGRVIPVEDLEGGPEAVGGAGYEVVGVMPPDFAWPVGDPAATDIWVPYVVPAEQRLRAEGSWARYLTVIARLSPGTSLEQARAQMAALGAAIERAHPRWNENVGVGVAPLADFVVGASMRSWLLMLLGAAALVLLVACANLASLLLAHGGARQREIGIRAALGAGRARLVRQMLAESLVLSAAGTLLAVLAAGWGIQALRAVIPEGVPRVSTIAIDVRVLSAAAGLALVTGLIAGIVPALHASRVDLTTALKSGAAGTTRGRPPLRQLFVVVEVAVAVVLVAGAALFIGSFMGVLRLDPGFVADGVLTAQVSPRVEGRTAPHDTAPLLAGIVEEVALAPGVIHAAATAGNVPFLGGFSMTTMTTPVMDLSQAAMVIVRRVTPGYHATLRIPLRRGRLFTAADRAGGRAVAILSEAAAAKYFPGVDPIGRVVGLEGEREVVGVVGNVRQLTLEAESRLEAYVPLAQSSAVGGSLLIRTSGDAYSLLPALRAAVFRAMPAVPLRNVATMEELVGQSLATRRFSMLLLSMFAALALAIVAVGLYGVVAHAVTLRTREIGVRMALGSPRSRVIGRVVGDALLLVAIGIVAGGVATWYAGAAAKAFLYRIDPTDPRAVAAAAAALLIVALCAAIGPARRAARVDPMIALRAE
jgi:putative ABC transport system permease protein